MRSSLKRCRGVASPQLWKGKRSSLARALMAESGIDVKPCLAQAKLFAQEGKTPMLAACGGRVAGVIAVADTVKKNSIDAVGQLRDMGVQVVMLTGDHEATAQAIAKQVGISEVFANVLPSEKADVIEQLQKKGKTVAMVGDGINDAPALTMAEIGIAIGSRHGCGNESADIVLMPGMIFPWWRRPSRFPAGRCASFRRISSGRLPTIR